MALKIEINGQLDKIVVTTMPRTYLTKIFRHCMGKNNTPYFANNCFKGVLYFDHELAIKFAQQVDFEWRGWQSAPALYQQQGFCFEQYLDMKVTVDDEPMQLPAAGLATNANEVELESFLPELKDEQEIGILLGSVDKGQVEYVLDNFDGEFDPSKLVVNIDSLASFRMQDSPITGLSYDGKPLVQAGLRSIGKNMIMPVMFDIEGEELDLNDFMSLF